MSLAVDLDEHFIKVPAPLAEPAHARDTLPPVVGRKQRSKAVPQKADGLMTEADTLFEQQVLDVA